MLAAVYMLLTARWCAPASPVTDNAACCCCCRLLLPLLLLLLLLLLLPQTVSGTATCKYIYRVMVTGPLVYTPEQLLDLGISMMGNAFGMVSNGFLCDAYAQAAPFCSYWSKAQMCTTYPWSQLTPYKCDWE
jgi:hypothetical protein